MIHILLDIEGPSELTENQVRRKLDSELIYVCDESHFYNDEYRPKGYVFYHSTHKGLKSGQ